MSSQLALSALLTFLLALSLWSINRRLPFALHSSLYGLIGFYSILGLGGAVLHTVLAEELGVSATIVLSESERFSTLNGLLTLAIACASGGVLWLRVTRTTRVAVVRRIPPPFSGWVALAALAPLALLIAGTGLSNVITRTEYLLVDIPPLKIAGSALAPCAILALGYVGAGAQRKSFVLSLAITFAYMLVFAALATRLLGLAPLFYLAGRFLARPVTSKSLAVGATVLVAVPFLVRGTMVLRSLPEQGLVPYVQAGLDGSLWRQPLGDLSATRNIFFGFDVTGHVMAEPPLTLDDLAVSLTPLPSTMTDWANRSESLRINMYTPFNTPGELLNYGWPMAVTYFVVVGILLAATDGVALSSETTSQLLPAISFVGLAWAFVVTSSQYNLRSSTRLLYYLVLLHAARGFWLLIRNNSALRCDGRRRIEGARWISISPTRR